MRSVQDWVKRYEEYCFMKPSREEIDKYARKVRAYSDHVHQVHVNQMVKRAIKRLSKGTVPYPQDYKVALLGYRKMVNGRMTRKIDRILSRI